MELVKTAGAPFYLNNIVKSSSLRSRKTLIATIGVHFFDVGTTITPFFLLWEQRCNMTSDN